jgi:integrase/recombinase XerD
MITHYQEEIKQKLNQVWRMERKSIVTIKNYNYALNELLDRLPVYFDEFNEDDLVAYCLTIPGINKRDLHITMIRAIYRTMHGINLDWKLFPYIKRKRKIQARFTTDEVQRMIDVLDNKGHKLLILTQFAAGLRVGELVILKKKDLYIEAGCLFIDGEGISNDRIVPIPAFVHGILTEYMKDKRNEDYLWPGQYGGHLSTRSVQQIINQAKDRAGINHNANSHGLRRGFATESVKVGTHLLAVRDILGHADIKTTQIYTSTDLQFLKDQINPAINLKVA